MYTDIPLQLRREFRVNLPPIHSLTLEKVVGEDRLLVLYRNHKRPVDIVGFYYRKIPHMLFHLWPGCRSGKDRKGLYCFRRRQGTLLKKKETAKLTC
jgi:hypothetical protein